MVVGKQHIDTMGVGTLLVDGSFAKLDASWRETMQNEHVFTVLFGKKYFCCLNQLNLHCSFNMFLASKSIMYSMFTVLFIQWDKNLIN